MRDHPTLRIRGALSPLKTLVEATEGNLEVPKHLRVNLLKECEESFAKIERELKSLYDSTHESAYDRMGENRNWNGYVLALMLSYARRSGSRNMLLLIEKLCRDSHFEELLDLIGLTIRSDKESIEEAKPYMGAPIESVLRRFGFQACSTYLPRDFFVYQGGLDSF